MEENDNIIPPELRGGEPTWIDVTDNDTILVRAIDVEGITSNPPMELAVITTTLNHDFLKVAKPVNLKLTWWIKCSDYELIEMLPPQIKSE